MVEIESPTRLQTHREHQDIIQQVLGTARERVLIISPYISISVINSENIPTLIRQALDRGVRIQVFVDSQRNCYSNGAMKDRAMEGIAALVEAGAQVAVCNGIQRKVLARDSDLFAEGGFNWLSAILFRNGEQQIGEGTTVYTGEHAALKISQELAIIDETEYEFASFSKCNRLEVTRAGKGFSLFCIMAAPVLIGKQLGDLLSGFVCSVLILAITTGLYWLLSRRANSLLVEQ